MDGTTLLAELRELRHQVTSEGSRILEDWNPTIHRQAFRSGAENLAYYMALRREDRRELQHRLLEMGLSSLGRCESRVMANLNAVIAALSRIEGEPFPEPFPSSEEIIQGDQAIELHSEELFGLGPADRRVRTMVTMPADAAHDPGLIHDLLMRGMDCARINCAHDGPAVWEQIIQNVRLESARVSRSCQVVADLGGPKARLGKVAHHHELPRLHRGDVLTLTRLGHLESVGEGFAAECQLGEAIDQLKVGAQVWIDDGKAGCRVRDRSEHTLTLDIFQAPPKGLRLRSDKGLNFPGSNLEVRALTEADLAALDCVAPKVDLVGYSFVQSAADVGVLLRELNRRGVDNLGLICKIETQRAVENLPEIIVAAAGQRPMGVMIARGDLAVEIGWERISEMQEEILWICEAAHVPVIWATQVLETLVKKGSPSRAEVTDAAMSERAECVMLNKGIYIREGLSLLVEVLKRMQEHQHKKMPRLRALRCWKY